MDVALTVADLASGLGTIYNINIVVLTLNPSICEVLVGAIAIIMSS